MTNETNAVLNVKRNIKVIQVNEAGDTITIDMDDQNFASRLTDLMAEFEKIAENSENRAKEIEQMPELTQKEQREKLKSSVALDTNICKELAAHTDEIFGEAACEKIFGPITPNVFAFSSFFEQLGELLQGFNKERAAEMQKKASKYTEKYRKRRAVGDGN